MFNSQSVKAEQSAQRPSFRKRFRFFFFDSMGRIDHGLERECQSDAEALGFATRQTGASMVEVWLEKRMIAKLYPQTAG
jgi:hypothetical protein